MGRVLCIGRNELLEGVRNFFAENDLLITAIVSAGFAVRAGSANASHPLDTSFIAQV